MNKSEFEIYKLLITGRYTQRELSELTGFSLGKVNQIIKNLDMKHSNIDNSNYLVKNAIILAAGFGLRMIPINQTPKALLTIKKEVLIERLIHQLHEVGIKDITIVVGFMKEKFEYLIDKYNLKLLVNNEYYKDSNSKSLFLASHLIGNSYIVPGDLYFYENPFSTLENDSWYMLSDEKSKRGFYYIDEKGFLIKGKNIFLNAVGLAYINNLDAKALVSNLRAVSSNEFSFWEDSLLDQKSFKIASKIIHKDCFFEINTYEQLRKIDQESESLKNEHIDLIKECFHIDVKDIKNVSTLKKGMTNRSFLFEVAQDKYIMRIPGEGTDKLINRHQEHQVYAKVNPLKISDEIIFFNPENGVKITKFINQTQVCNPFDKEDLERCIPFLRKFHEKKIIVDHAFDLYSQIEYYEELFNHQSLFKDYKEVKRNILKLRKIIEQFNAPHYLTHIDAVPDNFLIDPDGNIRLIDWEYAGMQDVHVDLAMFAIYAGYDKEYIDKIIDIYFCNECEENIRYKIYAYVAICGLLWSNWCEYKRMLGVEFGEYALTQYRYAKVYSRMVLKYFGDDNNGKN
ncbi:MAG: phosphotransferase [Anaeroplasmataceae bacterium]|nr:phosphotransferase [Anaeroplasmataceae bacterium]